jgi:hypothetical protein
MQGRLGIDATKQRRGFFHDFFIKQAQLFSPTYVSCYLSMTNKT